MMFDVKDTVTKRRSVRSYDSRALEQDTKEKILSYAEELENPIGPKIRIQFIDKNTAANGEKLGTYGIIKGADSFIGVTAVKEDYALEALGYEFEQIVLYATSLGLGTCWMGGTFKRAAFAAAMEIGENEMFPILSPIGYPAEKKSLAEKLMSKGVNSRSRFEWDKLFFENDFAKALTEEMAGEYAFPLEMVRLAPSAVNKQPWRVVMSDNAVHFYKSGNMSEGLGFDMQRIDLGIALCHFHLAAQEKGLKGHFERNKPELAEPKGTEYIISWIKD